MILYPAIDLKDGNCVRLLRGDMQEETIFNNDPTEQAHQFQTFGCEWLHLVDLNGAIEGRLINSKAVEKIIDKVNIPIQLGGGIRNLYSIEKWFDKGVNRIILGTLAVEDPQTLKSAARKYPNKIAVGIDARNGFVATNGWSKTTSIKALDMAKLYEDMGICAIIYTDIDRDGLMIGPNITQTASIANSVRIPIIASGGIASIKDLINLKKSCSNLNGIISGRAIYEKTLGLKEAINLLKDGEGA